MRNRLLLLYLLLLSGLPVAAQVVEPYRVPQAGIDTVGLHSKSAHPPAVVLDEDDGLYDVITAETYWAIAHGGPVMICEELPTYRARNRKDSLGLFIQQNLRWPNPRLCIDGRLFVSFIVGVDGQVYRAKVLNKLHPLFDAEALRVVQLLSGHLTPAVCSGKARPHEMVVPVTFWIQ
ncbi:energy transducer TonB [Hymenobacter psychrophilus]|uniref:TonB protein C-terminal n=1 Tax=Hymenobacter psychrophilus TaxID=651662 RepID=A0A1H3HSC7_9BACT|nr:energy transducer TonB [Hymenobacter psychrophilus]SDY17589.1 TonB protein C-terminal [Hymenobacter psychrophilus]